MIAESLEPTVRISSASSLFVFFALAFALMWICFFTVAFVPIPAGSPLGGSRARGDQIQLSRQPRGERNAPLAIAIFLVLNAPLIESLS